jgi:hypothetical protein
VDDLQRLLALDRSWSIDLTVWKRGSKVTRTITPEQRPAA